MKRCPECRRDYYDDSLLYCLDDGSALLEGPSSAKEMPTAILRELSEDNIQTKVHPASGSTSSESKDYTDKSRRLLIVGGAAVLAILAVSLTMYFRNEPVSVPAG